MNKILIGVLWLASVALAFYLGDFFGFAKETITPTEHGRFLSTPKVELLDDGRKLKLLEDFVYIDPKNQSWLAPKESEVDGASIPQLFWSATGGPLSGKYRNASIVHDVECVDEKNPSDDVHLMFYHACLAGGVPEQEAKRLYWAVQRFGPKWVHIKETRQVVTTGPDGAPKTYLVTVEVAVPKEVEEPTADDLAWADEYFKKNNPPVEIIPQLRDR